MIKTQSRQRILAISGLVISLLAWPAFGIFFGYSMGDVFVEDPEEQAKLVAQQQLVATLAGSVFLSSLPLAGWIAGKTYATHKILSLLTSLSILSLVVFLIAFMFLE